MSEMAPGSPELLDDFALRTWRKWWQQLPGWFRIGFWAGLGLVAVHLLLAVRIAIGLIEPPEFAALRRPGVHILVSSDYQAGPIPQLRYLIDGLKGRSCADVVSIRLDEQATDADLEHIGRHFRKVANLYLGSSAITSNGLRRLEGCKELNFLDLSMTDVDDSAATVLAEFQKLHSVDLSGTLVTDEAIPILRRLPLNNWVNLSHTDVSLEMIDTWRADAKGTGLRIGTDRDQNPNAIQGVVRWADGSRSGRFSDTYESKVAGPIVDQVPQRSSATMSSNLRRRDLWWDMAQFADTGDGEYEFSLKLGENLSAPVRVSIAHGQPSTTRIEFVMPVANPHSGN